MATAAKKTAPPVAAPTRRVIASEPQAAEATNTTHIDGAAEIVEATEGEKINLRPSVEDDAPKIEMCTAVVPKDFILTRDDGSVFKYEAGTCEMSVVDATHWFSRAAGVKIYSA